MSTEEQTLKAIGFYPYSGPLWARVTCDDAGKTQQMIAVKYSMDNDFTFYPSDEQGNRLWGLGKWLGVRNFVKEDQSTDEVLKPDFWPIEFTETWCCSTYNN